MEQRWKQLTADLCPTEIQEKWWTTIHGSLANSKQRKYYYNLQYLERRFSLYEQHKSQLSQPKAVALAIFFSHLHYDPHIHGIAEDLTLSTFRDFAAETRLPGELVDEVTRLIEAAVANSTPVHLTAGAYGSEDLHYFLDFDTAILGSASSDYADYAARMRDEYGFMSDHDYTQLRMKVLRCFLMIPNIFATKAFRDCYESQARNNIAKEIATIDESGKS